MLVKGDPAGGRLPLTMKAWLTRTLPNFANLHETFHIPVDIKRNGMHKDCFRYRHCPLVYYYDLLRKDIEASIAYVTSTDDVDDDFVLMPVDGRPCAGSFAALRTFPVRTPSTGRLYVDPMEDVDERSLRGVYMGDLAIVRQNLTFWEAYDARLICARNRSTVGYPSGFVDLAWKIALELDAGQHVDPKNFWTFIRRPAHGHYNCDNYFLGFVNEFTNRLGHLVVRAKKALKISRDERVRNDEPAPRELQIHTTMAQDIIDVDDEEDTQDEVIQPIYTLYKYATLTTLNFMTTLNILTVLTTLNHS